MFQDYSEDFPPSFFFKASFYRIPRWVKQRRDVLVLPGRCCCRDCGLEDPSLHGTHSHRLKTRAVCSLIKTGLKPENRRLTQLPATTTTPPHSTRQTLSGAHVSTLRSTLPFLPPCPGFSAPLGDPWGRGGWRRGSLWG